MTWTGTGSRSAKGEVSRFSSARTGSNPVRSCFSGWARARTLTICPPRIRRVSARGSRCCRLSTRRASRLPHRLHQPARHGHQEQRCERRQGGVRGFWGPDALQLDQGRDRAPARGGRDHRGDRLHSRDRARPRARQRQHPKHRPLAEEQLPSRKQARESYPGSDQLVRVRREQLQPGPGSRRLMRAFVEGVGLLGPGLQGWEAARRVLTGEEPFRSASTIIPASELLPPAERRRTPVPVKLALAVGQEAFQNAGRDAANTATVFTSSSGEGETLHQMCETLASAEPEVSPTRFHNSVHNAAAGYWSIATRSREASTSLCAYDASFSAGLIEALTQVVSWRKPVALIAYDQPYPEPLHSARPLLASFGAALVLTPEATGRTCASFELEFLPGEEKPTRMSDSALEELRLGVPAARALPLLEALARETEGDVVLDFLAETRLRVAVSPC